MILEIATRTRLFRLCWNFIIKKLHKRNFIKSKVIEDLYQGLKFEVEYYIVIVLVFYAVIKKNAFMLPAINNDCFSSPNPRLILDYSIILIIFAHEIITD